MKTTPSFLTSTLAIAFLGGVLGAASVNLSSPQVSVAQMMQTQAPKPLAPSLQGKPVVVDIYATWCPGCQTIAPTLSQLKKQYQGKVNFVVLDVSDKNTTKMAETKAKQLGLTTFFDANKTQTATVAIIDPATGMVIQQFRKNANAADYTKVIDGAISRMAKK
ncbi:redoxin domain-containing protein [Synechocystis sp. PCC 7339]|uniref:TlpA family protein disulfide reductase n=1 Tax=unclassified Synechocystis TaxID=2640012 RepID=UPI001BB00315|nr:MULTISPECIES: thioredoxin domain-containing protein [unclassified Synechocystis]QUS60123.1 redoxin domain-containing protein [Synechocystis sp. PCC 7338]UAJ72429.1 redoxin domain-containing protein [Synechocystis sp. PCC 7339]